MTPNLIDQFASLSNDALAHEGEQLYSRIGSAVSLRDWALIVAMAQRVKCPPVERKLRPSLDGALWLPELTA